MNQYNLGYTTGALLSEHFDTVVHHSKDFSLLTTGQESIDHSIITVNSESSQKKYLSEILKRLNGFHVPVLEFYKRADEKSKKVIQFYAVCHSYQIILEFMIDVVRNKWLHLDFELERYDYKSYLQDKLLEANQADHATENTLKKLTQIFFRMIRELGMYSGKQFRKIHVDDRLMKIITDCGDNWFLDVMLLSDNEKNNIC